MCSLSPVASYERFSWSLRSHLLYQGNAEKNCSLFACLLNDSSKLERSSPFLHNLYHAIAALRALSQLTVNASSCSRVRRANHHVPHHMQHIITAHTSPWEAQIQRTTSKIITKERRRSQDSRCADALSGVMSVSGLAY